MYVGMSVCVWFHQTLERWFKWCDGKRQFSIISFGWDACSILCCVAFGVVDNQYSSFMWIVCCRDSIMNVLEDSPTTEIASSVAPFCALCCPGCVMDAFSCIKKVSAYFYTILCILGFPSFYFKFDRFGFLLAPRPLSLPALGLGPDFGGSLPARSRLLGLAPDLMVLAPDFLGSLPARLGFFVFDFM